MFTLFGHEDSGHAYKVRLCLLSAEVAHQYRWIDIWSDRSSRPADFQQASRHQEVPLLLDGSEAYVQSGAILLHIAQLTGLFGGDSPERMARCREWIVWEANKLGMCVPQLRAKARFGDESINAGAEQWLLARFNSDIETLRTALNQGQGWVIPGDSPTVADFALCGYLLLIDEANLSLPDEVNAWLDRIRALSHWGTHLELLGQQAETV